MQCAHSRLAIPSRATRAEGEVSNRSSSRTDGEADVVCKTKYDIHTCRMHIAAIVADGFICTFVSCRWIVSLLWPSEASGR